MTFLYLDTSALVKRYIAEDGSDDVIALMADAAAVATSLVTRTGVVDVVFATFDRQLRKAAARAGLSTWPQ